MEISTKSAMFQIQELRNIISRPNHPHFGCWKRIWVTKHFFAHNVTLCNSVTFKFCVTLEFSWHHGNPKPKRFDFYIKYKPVDQTCPFHYHWLELFGLGIESCVAFLKSFSIQQLQQWLRIAGQQNVFKMYSYSKFKGHNSTEHQPLTTCCNWLAEESLY